MIVIENDDLKLSLSKVGAELRAVYDKKLKKDRMWSGDPVYWNRVSPILFPIVGKLKNGFYLHNDKKYELSRHGFIRDQEFTVEKQSLDSITFLFHSNEELKKIYPFDYSLRVTYRLDGFRVLVSWELKNTGDDFMYYSIGAHPSFILDETKDYIFSFEEKKKVNEISLKEGFVDAREETILEDIKIEAEIFKNNALIYEELETVVLRSTDDCEFVKLNFKGFPFVGLWSPYKNGEMAPFVCIEPWLGIADEYHTNQKLIDKKGILELPSGRSNHHEYEMIFHEE